MKHRLEALALALLLGEGVLCAARDSFATQLYLGIGVQDSTVKRGKTEQSFSETFSKLYMKNSLTGVDLRGKRFSIVVRSTLQSLFEDKVKNEFRQQYTFYGAQLLTPRGIFSYQADFKMRLVVKQAPRQGLLWDSDYYLFNLLTRYERKFTKDVEVRTESKFAYTSIPRDPDSNNYAGKIGLSLVVSLARRLFVTTSGYYQLAEFQRLVPSPIITQQFQLASSHNQRDQLMIVQGDFNYRRGWGHLVATYQLQENHSNSQLHRYHVQHAIICYDQALDRRANTFLLIRLGRRLKEFGNVTSYEDHYELEFEESLAHEFITVLLNQKVTRALRAEVDFTTSRYSANTEIADRFTRHRILVGLRYKP